MTIIDVLNDLSLTRSEELLGCVYFGRMIAPHQVARLMGVGNDYILKLKKDLNKKGKMILSHQPGRRSRTSIIFPDHYKTGPRMYELGPAGKKVVEGIIGRKINYSPLTGNQKAHFYGINDILVRTLEYLIDREYQRLNDEWPDDKKKEMARAYALEKVQWFNTQETSEIIEYAWASILDPNRWKGKEKDRQKLIDDLIFPDARLILEDRAYWIEYDNMTENIKPDPNRPKVLEKPNQTYVWDKFIKYINTMGPIGNRDIVIWVTPSEKRKQNMEQCWVEVKNSVTVQKKRQQVEQMGGKFFLPTMCFFTPGEEQNFLIQP
ncbi:hypothetical protein [Thermoactinomyces sp. CICC 10521]|uniref:hypothetical protein n=1 Tax=Thermoactinomyces sp. CICC 10521 TaxID=2767426 RepID=UPI0018DE734A|nr:hypothetical protein [Thermoactinomyces sp. CICC 10521]MBH8608741.1 hypothetical protein [Thermoactinomyces sp. CICC 10521]